MPSRATFEQRVAWHRDHAENCGCREMPKAIGEVLKPDRGEARETSSADSRSV